MGVERDLANTLEVSQAGRGSTKNLTLPQQQEHAQQPYHTYLTASSSSSMLRFCISFLKAEATAAEQSRAEHRRHDER